MLRRKDSGESSGGNAGIMVSKESLQLFKIFDQTRKLHAENESKWASLFDDPVDKSTMMGLTAGAPCSEIGINKSLQLNVGMAHSTSYLRKKLNQSPSSFGNSSKLFRAARHGEYGDQVFGNRNQSH